MTGTQGRRPLIVAAALAGAWLAAACSGAAGQQDGGAGGSDATAIVIGKTSSYLTIENRVGSPLIDVNVVVAAANGLTFSTSIPRLESAAKRDVPFSNIRSNDGTSFDPRWQRPTQIAVTATDFVGKKYDVKTRW
jgi:hypothetical protein